MQKKNRQNLLLNLIDSTRIGRQDVLAEKLGRRGFHVTQASVSRDLMELGIIKVNGFYVLPRDQPAATELGLRSLQAVGDNLIVGKCDSGLASAITVRIDAGRIEEIVGTIAGDDTIFIAVGDSIQQERAITKIRALFSA